MLDWLGDWLAKWWPLLLIIVAVAVWIALLTMIPPTYVWDESQCMATGARSGVPVWECVGTPR